MVADSSTKPSPAMLLALDFYRDPMALRDWLACSSTLPEGIGELIRLAGAREDGLQTAATVYQVDGEELGEAARFFLQQVLLAPGSNHYRVLGVDSDADDAQIRLQHRLLMRLFHPDRHVGQECWTDAYAARVNQAYSVLRRSQSRASYDRAQPPVVVAGDAPAAARAMDNGSESLRRAMARDSGLWSGPGSGAAPLAGELRGGGRGRGRWLLVAGVPLLVVVGLFGWLVRSGNHSVAMSPAAVGTAIVDQVSQANGMDRGAAAQSRERDTRTPQLLVLGLDDDGGKQSSAVSNSPQPVASAQAGVAHPSRVSLAAIPRSRGIAATGSDHRAPSLVIPPARTVDIPEPTPIAMPADSLVDDRTAKPVAKPVAKPTATPDADPTGRGRSRKPSERSAKAAPFPGGDETSTAVGVVADTQSAAAVFVVTQENRSDAAVRDQKKTLYVAGAVVEAVPPQDRAIAESALMSLLGQLVNSYQRGDLATFVGLFSAQASTSDEASRQEIEDEYRQLFSSTRVRRLQVSGLSWQMHPGGARGEGYMVIQIRRRGGDMERYQGRFTVRVTREHRHLRISGLYYDLERA